MNTSRRRLFTAVRRTIFLLACATVGGAAVLLSIWAYASVALYANPLSFQQWRVDEHGFLPSLIGVGLVTGTFGLGYLHVLLAYSLVLRRLPDFWSALPRYFLALYLGTIVTSIIFMHIRSGSTAAAEAIIIAVPLGFWGTVLLLWRRLKRGV